MENFGEQSEIINTEEIIFYYQKQDLSANKVNSMHLKVEFLQLVSS